MRKMFSSNKAPTMTPEMTRRILYGLSVALAFSSCAPATPRNLSIPSLDYASRLKKDYAASNPDYRARVANNSLGQQASLGSVGNLAPSVRFANDKLAVEQARNLHNHQGFAAGAGLPPGTVSNLNGDGTFRNVAEFSDGTYPGAQGFTSQESTRPDIRDYTGPLSLGEPGVSSSLWRETRSLNLVRDVRAFLPMDLITIVVQENAEGKREADTDIKQNSKMSASLSALLGLDDTLIKSNPQLLSGDNTTLANILNTEFNSEFKGEGETTRKGSLKGKISAMIVEVLPSGVLRVEGEKILSVNNEDEIMVISGLIRPEDVTSNNEVSSGKLANMRIDYYGQGTVGDAQVGGWASRFLRRLWPF